VDLKPGGIELRPYEDVMARLAITPTQARRVMKEFEDEMQRRGDVMGAAGIREWPVTEQDPFMVLIIDEAFELKRHGLEKQAEDITALARAFGGCILVATQHPTDRALSMIIKANCPQKVGARTEGPSADRVIFGENATADGWRPSKIPLARQGSFMIRNRRHSRPLLARAFLITDKDRDREVRRWATSRTSLGGSQMAVQTSNPLPGTTTPDIHDAVIVEHPVATGSPILDAIRAGANTVTLIVDRTGISRPTVYRRLQELQADEVVRQGKKRGTWEIKE
jgi:S-DNA-T family DNA segregation ATPase FtsK/SpoIIIE